MEGERWGEDFLASYSSFFSLSPSFLTDIVVLFCNAITFCGSSHIYILCICERMHQCIAVEKCFSIDEKLKRSVLGQQGHKDENTFRECN